MRPSDTHHIPALDGLRGIAVIAVILYHLDYLTPGLYTWVKGGFLGVDIFFVLSGFLITSILIREYDNSGQINLWNFYVKRTLRLMPALWLFLIFVYLFGGQLLSAASANTIYSGNNFLYAMLYVMNWHSATGGAAGNLNHTWSLAIEEQFYILWSLVLFIAFSWSFNKRTITVFTLITVIVLVCLRTAKTYGGYSTIYLYYSTENRIDAILIGCLAAMGYGWKLIPERFYDRSVIDRLFGASLIVATGILMIFSHEDRLLYYGFNSLFSVAIGISILWLISQRHTFIHSFFENRLLCWVGHISYGLYLWHFLFFDIAKNTTGPAWLRVSAALLLSFTASSVSFYSVEKFALSLKKFLLVEPKKAELTVARSG